MVNSYSRKPFFSIIILFWKSDKFLPQCLEALNAQTFKDFEVLLLNNGADKPPNPNLLASFSELDFHLIHSSKNLGFAGGNNFAARSAKGEYLALLNGDAFPQPDWLENIQQAVQIYPKHFFASR